MIAALAVAFIGVLGVAVGAVLTSWLGGKRERATRRAEFLTRQLQEFYGPLLSMRKEILARSELRVKIQQSADSLHLRDLVEAGPGRQDDVTDGYLPGLLKMVRDENETFENILMPRYREMVSLFREKMWLAEPETRSHFAALVEFVDVWDKILREALPREIAPAIGHTEENLKPLYANLESIHDRLRGELSR
jgi:hypothetical protein